MKELINLENGVLTIGKTWKLQIYICKEGDQSPQLWLRLGPHSSRRQICFNMLRIIDITT